MNEEGIRISDFEKVLSVIGGFGRYQLRVFFATQLAYIAVTASMLCTVYDAVRSADSSCDGANITGRSEAADNCTSNCSVSDSAAQADEFYSLLQHMHLDCAGTYIPTLMNTVIMVGAAVGAFCFGMAADRFGRKPICCVSLGCVIVINLIMTTVPRVGNYLALICVLALLFALGACASGYLVVNLVILLESVGQEWRLMCTCFNGWPLGMITIALTAFLSKDWRLFHLAIAVEGVPCLVALLCLLESPRWLIQHGQVDTALSVINKIAIANRRPLPSFDQSDLDSLMVDSLANIPLDSAQSAAASSRTYSYFDLAKHRAVFFSLLAVTYCWFASSVISFGIYFNLGSLAGDRYLNNFLTGLFKGIAGISPILFDRCSGRRPLMIVSSLITCISMWIVVCLYLLVNALSVWITVFIVISAASLDPVWKVNHLYSTELFPTVVRNMARAVCTVGGRVGGVLGPQVNYLSYTEISAPYVVFGILSTIHVFVAIMFLPETRQLPLPDKLPALNENNDTCRRHNAAGNPSSTAKAADAADDQML